MCLRGGRRQEPPGPGSPRVGAPSSHGARPELSAQLVAMSPPVTEEGSSSPPGRSAIAAEHRAPSLSHRLHPKHYF